MDYRKLSDADLADFAKNVHSRLTAHEIAGLPNDIADDLAATFAPLNTNFETSIETSVVKTAMKQSETAQKQSLRDDVIFRLSTVRNYLVAAGSPKKAFQAAGFTFPSTGASVIAQDPTDLAGAGTSNGVNRITWTGNNRVGSVVYEIWRRQGDSGDWGIKASTRKQFYVDTPVTPGQYYEYKVRAVAATNTSNFSNSAVVYGTI